MTPQALAALYSAAFPTSRAWKEAEFADLLDQPTTFLSEAGRHGFAIGRVVAGEAELITLAVAPKARHKGHGRALLGGFERMARTKGAERAFLEVAADNIPALALYHAGDWRISGRRCDYYKRQGGAVCDALLLEKDLTCRQERA